MNKLILIFALIFISSVAMFARNIRHIDVKMGIILSDTNDKTSDTLNNIVEEEVEDEEAQTNETYNFYIIEQKPEFPGGMTAMMKFLVDNIKYPVEAKEKRIEGRVYVQFLINEKGKVTNVKVVKPLNPLLDKEAVRVVKMMPRWKPGKQRGKNVKVLYMLPINFKL